MANLTINNLLGGTEANPATFVAGDLPLTLVAPTVREGYVFSGYSTDVYGNDMITQVTVEEDTALYAQWLLIGDFVFIDVHVKADYRFKINKNFIVEVKPLVMAESGVNKWRILITVSPGTRYFLKTKYSSKAEAYEAREQFLALLV